MAREEREKEEWGEAEEDEGEEEEKEHEEEEQQQQQQERVGPRARRAAGPPVHAAPPQAGPRHFPRKPCLNICGPFLV